MTRVLIQALDDFSVFFFFFFVFLFCFVFCLFCILFFFFFIFFITEKQRNLLTFDMLSYVSKSHGSVARPIMRGRRMWSDHVTP